MQPFRVRNALAIYLTELTYSWFNFSAIRSNTDIRHRFFRLARWRLIYGAFYNSMCNVYRSYINNCRIE